MPGFPTVADLTDYQSSTPDMALRVAVNRLVSELGWDPRESVRTYASRGGSVLLLPALNVTSVSTHPVAFGASASAGGIVRVPAGWVGLITYTAGWPEADLPQVLSDVVLEWAAGWKDNPRGLRSWTTGSEAETYAVVPSALGSVDDSRLDPYRVGMQVA